MRQGPANRPVAAEPSLPGAHVLGRAEPRTLLIASAGGHLEELWRLAPRIGFAGRPLWVTFDTPQSRSLLAGTDAVFVRHTAPRDAKNVCRNVPAAVRVLGQHNVVEAVSTGAAIALPFLLAARVRGIPAHYIESAARSHAPSVTGRVMARAPGITCYTQHRRWANDTWRWGGSVFDEFLPVPRPRDEQGTSHLRLFIALGTQGYRFDRLVESVRRVALPGWDLRWQTGPVDYGCLAGQQTELMSAASFLDSCRWADVVIGQAGVGTALSALEAGRVPILVPRAHALHEHVDDHQRLIGAELLDRRLARVVHGSGLTLNDIVDAASFTVERQRLLPAFDLVPPTGRTSIPSV